MADNLMAAAATYGITIPPGTGSFSQPDISNEFSPRPQSKGLSGAMVAMLVVGVVLGLGLLGVAVGYSRQSRKYATPSADISSSSSVLAPASVKSGSMYSIVPAP
jgi:predicted histidine transporter YuiF (NhaC family)